MRIESEEWRAIDGANYEVSSYGRVRNQSSGRILQPWVGDKAGHLRVDLHGQRPYVHQLVASAFLAHSPGEVCHSDNDPTNNRVENLRYDSRSANVRDLRSERPYCPNGHEFTGDNTYIEPSTGWRRCRECKRRARNGTDSDNQA